MARLKGGCGKGGWFQKGDVIDFAALQRAVQEAQKFGVRERERERERQREREREMPVDSTTLHTHAHR